MSVKTNLDKNFIANKSGYFFDEFLRNTQKYKALAHFRRSPGGWLVMLKIMEYYYLDKDIHVEELIRKIPVNVASRLSIFTLINHAEKKGLILKNGSNSDKRRKTIKPSDRFIKEYNEWMTNFINLNLNKD